MLGQILYNIDLLGLPATLNHAGREKSKSKFGGACSILFFGFVAWTAINGSRDLFSKVNPKIISSQSNNEEPPGASMSPEDFPLAFQVQTSDDLNFMTYVDNSIYNLNVYFSRAYRVVKEDGTVDTIWNDTKLVLEKCRPEHMGQELNSVYTKIFDLPMQCIAFNQPGLDEEVRISGTYNSEVWRRLLIELAPCNNATSPIPCAPPETIESIISGGWLDVLYNNVVVNPNDYDHPNGVFQDYYYTMLSLSNYYETYIDLGKIEISTDSGWLVEDIERKTYSNVVKISDSMLGKPHPRGILAGVTIEMGKLENYYTRRYKKIQDVLAEIAGLTNAGLLALLLLTSPYLRLKFRESLMNELFDVKLPRAHEAKKKPQECREKQKIIQHNDRKKSARTQQRKLTANVQAPPSELFQLKKSNSLNSLPENIEITENLTKNTKYNIESRELDKQTILSIPEDPQLNKGSKPKPKPISKTPNLETNASLTGLLAKDKIKLPSQPSYKILLASVKETARDENSTHRARSPQPSAKVLEESEEEGVRDFSSFDYDGYGSDAREKNKTQNDLEMQKPRKSILSDSMKEKAKLRSSSQEKRKVQTKYLEEKDSKKEKTPPDRLEINFLEYICSFGYFKPKALQHKLKVLNEGVREIDSRLDVRYILNNIRELEKLRALLLDPDQLLLFENLPKAQLRVDEEDNEEKSLEVSFKQMLLRKNCVGPDKSLEQQVTEAYNRIKNKKDKTAVDCKLLEVFDESGM